jgi:hypothetical protein
MATIIAARGRGGRAPAPGGSIRGGRGGRGRHHFDFPLKSLSLSLSLLESLFVCIASHKITLLDFR